MANLLNGASIVLAVQVTFQQPWLQNMQNVSVARIFNMSVCPLVNTKISWQLRYSHFASKRSDFNLSSLSLFFFFFFGISYYCFRKCVMESLYLQATLARSRLKRVTQMLQISVGTIILPIRTCFYSIAFYYCRLLQDWSSEILGSKMQHESDQDIYGSKFEFVKSNIHQESIEEIRFSDNCLFVALG